MSPAPHIVLVHGLARSKHDMFLMGPRLRARLPQSQIHTFDYHSRKYTIAQVTEQLRDFVNGITTSEPVSFVGHSLGGVLVRSLDLTGGCKAPLHRLVTLGTPHNGAVIAKTGAKISIVRAFYGPVLRELGHLSLDERPRQLEIACVVGGTGFRFGFVPFFGADNDGVVAAREAHLTTCKESTRVPIYHTFFPYSRRAADLAATFLSTGAWRR